MHITVEVEVDLAQVTDADLLRELRERNLDGGSIEGARKEDLVRAVAGKRWEEVDYLLRTYFLRRELQIIPPPRRLTQSLAA